MDRFMRFNSVIDRQVPQCGYCQSSADVGGGIVNNPNPSDADIDTAMRAMSVAAACMDGFDRRSSR